MFIHGIGELDYNLHVSYRILHVIGPAVFPDEVEIAKQVRHERIFVALKVFLHSRQVHGLLYDSWVVIQPQTLVIHRLEELKSLDLILEVLD